MAWSNQKGQTGWSKFDTNLCFLEHSWACSRPGKIYYIYMIIYIHILILILHFETFFCFWQFNFEGNYDLLKFIKLLGDNGMWVTLRIGPYIEAEWNLGYLICFLTTYIQWVTFVCTLCYFICSFSYRGFPYWLKEVPNITFRSYNEPFLVRQRTMHIHCWNRMIGLMFFPIYTQFHMKRYAENVINMVKAEKLFADQGGPIIMAQVSVLCSHIWSDKYCPNILT